MKVKRLSVYQLACWLSAYRRYGSEPTYISPSNLSEKVQTSPDAGAMHERMGSDAAFALALSILFKRYLTEEEFLSLTAEKKPEKFKNRRLWFRWRYETCEELELAFHFTDELDEMIGDEDVEIQP